MILDSQEDVLLLPRRGAPRQLDVRVRHERVRIDVRHPGISGSLLTRVDVTRREKDGGDTTEARERERARERDRERGDEIHSKTAATQQKNQSDSTIPAFQSPIIVQEEREGGRQRTSSFLQWSFLQWKVEVMRYE